MMTKFPFQIGKQPYLAFTISLLTIITLGCFLVVSRIKPSKDISPLSHQYQSPLRFAKSPIPTGHPYTDTATWQSFTMSTIGLAFKLPPDIQVNPYGMHEEIYAGKQGYSFTYVPYPQEAGTFINRYRFSMQTNSVDFIPLGGRSYIFSDYEGFTRKNDKFYALLGDGKFEEIPSQVINKEVVNSHGVDIIKIIGVDYTANDTYDHSFTLGKGYYGALINSHNHQYPGISFTMMVPEQEFDLILSTFTFAN